MPRCWQARAPRWRCGFRCQWFTGPLIAVASANMLGARLAGIAHVRDVGQWIIGTALALYFTPEVVRALLQLAPWVGLTTLAMIALGLAAARVLERTTGKSGTTSFFAMAIGGASEMAAQAERYGGRVDRVAAAHSLRIMLVALIVPFALQWAGCRGLTRTGRRRRTPTRSASPCLLPSPAAARSGSRG